jgi:hypothetical protein
MNIPNSVGIDHGLWLLTEDFALPGGTIAELPNALFWLSPCTTTLKWPKNTLWGSLGLINPKS